MLEPGNDALCRDLRCPGRTANRAAMRGDPVAEQSPRIGGGKFGACGAQIAQPAKIVQGSLPRGIGRLNQERRASTGLDDLARKGEAAMVKLLGELRIGGAKILRCYKHTFRCESGESPAIERAHAHTPAEAAPQLRRCKSPQLRCFAQRDHVVIASNCRRQRRTMEPKRLKF